MDKILLQFLAVADEGNISKAAAALLVTQPTLTFNLKKLEQNLGVDLFERTSRGVTLTRYGETLYEHAAIMKRLYGNAIESIERQRLRQEEILSIGSGYSWWSLFLRQIVLDHATQNPAVPINISLSNALRCMDQLLAGDISLFIGHRLDDLAPGIRAQYIPLGLVKDGYFVRTGHPLLQPQRTLEDIRQYPSTMAFPPETRQHRLLIDQDYGDRPSPQPEYVGRSFTSNSLDACLEFVAATDAVLRHTDLMADEFRAKGFEMVDVIPDERPKLRPVGIYVLPERRADRRVEELISLIELRAGSVIVDR